MLTPTDISDRVSGFRRATRYDQLSKARLTREVFLLYRDVLIEVARGSIDPKSLAIAALKAEEKFSK